MIFRKIFCVVCAILFTIYSENLAMTTTGEKSLSDIELKLTPEQQRQLDSIKLDNQRNLIVEKALNYIGTPYRWGAEGPTKFDCSGFTKYVYDIQEIELTRCSYTQYYEGIVIKEIENLKPGDLVFFGGRNKTRTVRHVGIVKEVDSLNNTFAFIHASNSGVRIDSLHNAYYKKRYIGARRIIKEDII